ncbi:hypothetical protein D1B31_10170 [Neobacillus notoginsengisoli]|uniref:YppF family protein n=1 Tax=Neobacillus notoginsengisoli TaxID=1578198 RepID=A0A417YVD3_9BACI|nr:YppF family protein [Neobacillus notoginsengisoli]RHW41287.1 hypothetical protein D1B31_10170 [Neobacillus notoginsengisoli]
MDMSMLKKQFLQCKKQDAEFLNELRDYARNLYIQNEITAAVFRKLIQELEAEGATVPENVEEEQLT